MAWPRPSDSTLIGFYQLNYCERISVKLVSEYNTLYNKMHLKLFLTNGVSISMYFGMFAEHLPGPEGKPWMPVLAVWSSWCWRWRWCDIGGESHDHHGTPPHLWVLGRWVVTSSSSPSESPWLPSKTRPTMQRSICILQCKCVYVIQRYVLRCERVYVICSPVWKSICDTRQYSAV